MEILFVVAVLLAIGRAPTISDVIWKQKSGDIVDEFIRQRKAEEIKRHRNSKLNNQAINLINQHNKKRENENG